MTGYMPRDPINSKHKPLLWGKAAGCCELCAKPVYEEGLQRQEGNYSNIAHINAAQPGGPRYDAGQTSEERSSIDNLMLLCQECHKLIDANPDDYPAPMLHAMKIERECAVASLMEGLQQERCTVVKYLVPFGESDFTLSDSEWKRALFSRRFAYNGLRAYDLNHSGESARDAGSIPSLAKNLETAVARFRGIGYESGPIAIFALAPQPLLIKLGCLLGDEAGLIAFQRSRTEGNWSGDESVVAPSFELKTPYHFEDASEAGLILSISGIVNPKTIPNEVSDPAIPTYEITVSSPGICAADHPKAAEMFRIFATNSLYRIHEANPKVQRLHIFPAAPASLNIAFGAAINTNVIPEYVVYEKRDGFFAVSLTIGGKDEPEQ